MILQYFQQCMTYQNLQIYYSPSNRDLKSSQVIVSDKSNLARKVDFLLKSSFQIMTIFIPLKVGYLVIIVVNFSCKWAQQFFSGCHKIMFDWFIFLEYFQNWWFNFIMVTWLYYFSKKATKMITIKF